MITKTTTEARFLYSWDDDSEHQYCKESYENELINFVKPIENIELETFLENLLVHQDLIKAEKVENIQIIYTIFFDLECWPEFSEKTINLLHELGARLDVRPQRNFEGETLYQVLDRMRERPAMYVGEYSITSMYHFIAGFFTACNGGTKEVPNFDGFNDFVGEYYGKYTTPGWKNLILSDHFGNEEEALRQFYTLLDKFREMRNAPSARDIVYKLLAHLIYHLRGDSNRISHYFIRDEKDLIKNKALIYEDLWHMNVAADMFFKVTSAMKQARYAFEYDDILQHIFSRAAEELYLHDYIKSIAPKTAFYEYVLLENDDEILMLKNKDNTTDKKVLKTFFAINDQKAEELKTFLLRTTKFK